MLVALAALALPASGMAAETGAIKGTVTGEGGGSLAGVRVCAEETNEADFECAKTGLTGEYEVAGLEAGQYTVDFAPPSGMNYVRQFYNGKTSFETATPVTVVAGVAAPSINATLEKGAKINGVVTAAATGQPFGGVEVCAFGVSVENYDCGESNGAGSYSVVGLAAGQYEVYSSPKGLARTLRARRTGSAWSPSRRKAKSMGSTRRCSPAARSAAPSAWRRLERRSSASASASPKPNFSNRSAA